MGSLRSLTVQPATKQRYQNAVDGFLRFLQTERISLPRQKERLDPLVGDYIEHLWSTGAGRALASDTLAGLQDKVPGLRHNLPGAWRLLKTWAIHEIPNRAPPIPEHILHAMAGWAFFKGHYGFGISLVIGFYTMLRSGELIDLKSWNILCSPNDRQALISLGLTKSGKRQGAAESVVLGMELAVKLVKKWKELATPSLPLVPSAYRWRLLFSQCLDALSLSAHAFRPHSLRRGGATFWFSKHQSLDRILVQGRWAAQRSARIYINEGLAMLASFQVPRSNRHISPYLHVFSRTVATLSFSTLEPPRSGSAGGRGKKGKRKTKVRRKGPKKEQDLDFSV
eukprot:Skav228094  [mRNA]  locus=scaffold784:46459:47475:+ [translate_table: standard]